MSTPSFKHKKQTAPSLGQQASPADAMGSPRPRADERSSSDPTRDMIPRQPSFSSINPLEANAQEMRLGIILSRNGYKYVITNILYTNKMIPKNERVYKPYTDGDNGPN